MDNKSSTDNSTLEFAYEFHQTMLQNKLIFAYEGEVTQQLMKVFTSLAKENLQQEEEQTKVKKRVFHVMVESLQNLSKHSGDAETGKNKENGSGIFLVGRDKKHYKVTTGNSIAVKRVAEIKALFDKINNMDRKAIKKFYKKTLQENRLSDKGGAGLGFIDIVKKTGSPIDYHFISINEVSSYMLYQIKVYRQ